MTAVQYDGPITIAVGQSRRSTQWQNRDLMWSQLVNRLEIPERTQESAKEYKTLPKAQRDEIKDVGGFVGGVLKGGRRKADAITQRRLLTLDLDEVPADADPWDTVVLVLGCAAVLYSTHSHRPDAPRLRLVMPLSRAVSPEEYAAVARKIAQDIGKVRRKALSEIAEQIGTLRDELETLRDEEDEYRENIPESLQGGEKYELSESASDSMNKALDSLDEAIGSIESAAE